MKDLLNMNSTNVVSSTGCCAASNEGGVVGSQMRLRSYEDLAILLQETLGKLFPLDGPFLSLADCRAVLKTVNNGFRALGHSARSEARSALRALRDELSLSDPNGAWSKDIHADLNDTLRQCASPLNTLPLGLVHHITGYLGEADVRAAGAVNQKFRQATEGRLLAQAIQTHFSVLLPQGDVIAAFQVFLARIQTLDGYLQGYPLMALSERLIRLHDLADRARVFDQILSVVEAMPARFRSKPLAVLGERFWELPHEDMHGRFDAILNLAIDLPFDEGWPVFEALAGSLNSLTDGSVTKRFHALLDVAHGAPLARRSACVVSLAKQLACLPDDLRKSGVDAVLDRVKALPDAQRAPPLVALVDRLPVLPDSTSKLQVLHAILAVVESMTEGRERVLIEAALGLYGLGSADRVLARAAILKVTDQLPPEQRLLVQAQLEPMDV